MPDAPIILKDGPIRRFADGGIQKAIDDALATLPPDKHVAVVAYANLGGARLAVLGRVGAHTEWTLVVDKPWNKPLEAQAAVRFSL